MNMNKEYVFPFSDSTEHSPEVSVDTFLWENNGYTPRTTAKLAINTEKLMLHMECIECKPLARFTVNGSPVCRDSCMEFFFAPIGDNRYCSLEINANGCFLCCIGTSRYDRTDTDILLSAPRAAVKEDRWYIDADISLKKLRNLFGTDQFDYFTGNFYKCGDKTRYPHYGMWSEVKSETPDFHRPEAFGKLIYRQ